MISKYANPLYKSDCHLRLDGGARDEDGRSSSSSLERLRLVVSIVPRLAADIFERSGELLDVRELFAKNANAPTECAVL